MSVGYFIGLGDKTTCGGEVLDGDKRINIHGLFHACEGDRVTCGKDGQTYRIVGGISFMNSHGRLMAGTLDSYSDCPCKAELVPSVFSAKYHSRGGSVVSANRQAAEKVRPTTHWAAPSQNAYTPTSHSAPPAFNNLSSQDPGFISCPKA